MYILLEATITDKESVALYHKNGDKEYTEHEVLAEFETKLGQAMKAEAYKGELLIAFEHTGKIIKQASVIKDNVSFSPRLVWVQSTAQGEGEPDQSKKADRNILEADYHIKKGTAMKNSDVKGLLLLGIDNTNIVINDYYVRPVTEE